MFEVKGLSRPANNDDKRAANLSISSPLSAKSHNVTLKDALMAIAPHSTFTLYRLYPSLEPIAWPT